MPGRRLREARADRALRAFQKAGYVIARVVGSHTYWCVKAVRLISLPRHSTIKVGLLMAKVKAAGTTYGELEDLI